MFKNYLKTSLRSLSKNPLSSFINLFGLAIAIGICLIVYSFMEFDLTIDDFHENKDKVYLTTFYVDGDGTENKFISEPLEGAKSALYNDFFEFEIFISTNFFVYENSRSERGSYLCMRPEWNCDRANPSPEEMAMYDEKSRELSVLGERVLDAYKTYRNLVKEVYAI